MGGPCWHCGEKHDEVAPDFRRPDALFAIPEAEREARVDQTDDGVFIDRRAYFIRGVLPVPVIGRAEPYDLGFWARVSHAAYVEYGNSTDFVVRPSGENARRTIEALRAFGAPLASAGVSERDFATPGQHGIPPLALLRRHLQTGTSGVRVPVAVLVAGSPSNSTGRHPRTAPRTRARWGPAPRRPPGNPAGGYASGSPHSQIRTHLDSHRP